MWADCCDYQLEMVEYEGELVESPTWDESGRILFHRVSETSILECRRSMLA